MGLGRRSFVQRKLDLAEFVGWAALVLWPIWAYGVLVTWGCMRASAEHQGFGICAPRFYMGVVLGMIAPGVGLALGKALGRRQIRAWPLIRLTSSVAIAVACFLGGAVLMSIAVVGP